MRRHLPATAAAVVATAVAGGIGTDVGSRWYERLDKPRWQPPGWAFGPAWTTLYALVAVSSARVLDRAEPEDRTAFATALGANLVLNTGWTWVFFTAAEATLGAAGDPGPRGVHAGPRAAGPPGGPHRGGPARAVRRVGRLRHRPDRQHRPPQPLGLNGSVSKVHTVWFDNGGRHLVNQSNYDTRNGGSSYRMLENVNVEV